METVVGIEDNDDGKFEDSGVGRSSSALSSPKQISNPIVYKLVRVEGDGRLVPATDDEVMEVGDFLEYENSEMHVVADTGQSLECISIERSSSGKLRLECSEGSAEADLGKLNAKLQYIEQILQKVKEEEKQRISCGSPVHSHVNIDSQCSADKCPAMDGKVQSEPPYQEIPSIASSLNYTHSNQSGSIDQCSRPSEGVIESGSSASAVHSNLKPDLSISDGEICLDKLSIRELHELFKVTFGRETTVKDKQWLKRRIAMSLTNSCDVSATTFIIKDNKIVRKFVEESAGNMNAASLISSETVTEEDDVNFKDSSAVNACGIDDNQVVSEIRLRNHNTEYGLEDENHQTDQKAAKRIRRPTKRYIEELSENEHNPRLPICNKNMGLGQVSPTSYVRPGRNAFSERRSYGRRFESLGGSDVHIPCVSRIRRSRPRKDMASLMKFHPTAMSETAKLSNRLIEHSFDAGGEIPDKVLMSKMPAKLHQPSSSEPEKEKQCPVVGTIEPRQELRPKRADPSGHTSDDNIVTVPTAKGGMRRKHHRAWTLVEVIKLVEGVSRCGAGRWSEIKRLSFASYSYRTSVDLKDKWRNLLKASFALTPAPADEGINSRKHGTAPIPEKILLRVRELAEMNSQVPPNYSSNKVAAGAGSVHGDRSGVDYRKKLSCLPFSWFKRKIKMGIIEKIKEIEAEMARTQKNKATEYHLGQLKAKIAKLRTQLLEPPKGSSGGGEGFEVTKFGHGRVALIGFPSVGKSTLLTMLTGTHSEAASYEFTTLTCIPGIIHYNDTKIQLLDLPGIIEGASEGKGRGRQVIAVAKSSDIVLMVLDASKSEGHRQILTRELEAVGLRLNKRPPQIYFKKKKTGGISFNSTLPLTHVDEKLCYQILHEYKIHNAEVLFREDATVDDLIDVIEGNRKYMKCVYVYNKIDVIGIDDVDRLARQPNSVVISCNLKLNLDRLLGRMWDEMGLVRVYTKPQGQQPDFSDPVVLSVDRGGCTVEDFCNHIHRSLVKDVKYVLVWGTSARHYPQHCGLSHNLRDEDVVQIVKKKEKEEGGRGRFKSHSNAPARISDREKKAPLKT
ncbi:unnamed protein product [Sphenostylis stenocarpa]|uniref:Uncharacterized protein n=2 Tax=Magnoliopsida TaxID=3398 RepID=A0AA86VYE1_9FABA|nr:unnamed protein product [Sphenostylis stenocarpa]